MEIGEDQVLSRYATSETRVLKSGETVLLYRV